MNARTAVVTGGSRGIGRAVVRRLARDGYRVCAIGRDRAALAEAIEPIGDRAELRVADVADPDSLAALEDLRVDVLVYAAGVASAATVARTTENEWHQAMAVNATGVFLWTRAVLPGMRSRGWGRIVAIGSTASHVGTSYTAAYTASKHAALGFMRVVAAESAGSGITANTVCPSFTDTDMTAATVARIVTSTGRTADEASAALIDSGPLGRLLRPEEVASAVSFLASEEAAAINGQTVVLDGGGIQR